MRRSSGGGSLALDWWVPVLVGACAAADTPIVLLFPGVGACAPGIGFGSMLLGAIRDDWARRDRPVREWDTACLPAYGFETLTDMFAHADPVAHFDALPPSIRVVLFNAADDWIAPSTRLTMGPDARMPNVALVQTQAGGHLGWVDGVGRCRWITDATVRLVDGAVRD